MKILIIVFFILYSNFSTLFAIDWLLFQPGQINYYQINNSLMEFSFDSVLHNSNDSYTYFSNRLKDYSIYQGCDSSIINSSYFPKNYLIPRFDSFTFKSDTLFYYDDWFGKLDTENYFFLPLNLQLNQILKFNDISIKLVEEGYKEILTNISDSTKNYEINIKGLLTINIILSKHYGLLQFIDFHRITNIRDATEDYFNLIGFKNNNGKFGSIPKKFDTEDLFQMSVGDVKYWSHKYNHGDNKDYVRDILVSKYELNNFARTLIVTYQRSFFSINGEKMNETIQTEYYQLHYLDKIISNRENIYFVDSLFQRPQKILCFGGDYLQITDSNMTFNMNPMMFQRIGILVSDNCEVSPLTDTYEIQILNPVIGYSYLAYDDMNFGTNYKLIGFEYNKELYGVIPPFMNNVDNEEMNKIDISPNPTYDILKLTNFSDGDFRIEIYDIFGERVLSIETQNFVSLQNIDVSSLPTGVYFLKLNNHKPIKFVKL